MSLNPRWSLFGVLVLGALCPSARAFAQEKSEINAACARAYEEAQEQRKSGQLVLARSTLQSCARDECPEFIHNDCGAWYGEVQNEVPTLVFAARSQGRDLSEVRVLAGARELSSHIDGQVVELDPGEYDFEFQAVGMRLLEQHFVIARGERNRLIQVELEPMTTEPGGPGSPGVAPSTRRSLLWPGIFAGAGALGVAGFATFAVWGRSNQSKLERTCSPVCNPEQVSDVRTKYVIADVSLGVGVASLAVGAYLFFNRSSVVQAHAGAPRIAVTASPRDARLLYGGEF
jgi:hypothetical protein